MNNDRGGEPKDHRRNCQSFMHGSTDHQTNFAPTEKHCTVLLIFRELDSISVISILSILHSLCFLTSSSQQRQSSPPHKTVRMLDPPGLLREVLLKHTAVCNRVNNLIVSLNTMFTKRAGGLRASGHQASSHRLVKFTRRLRATKANKMRTVYPSMLLYSRKKVPH